MTIGDVVTKETYTAAAIWCNSNNAHIEQENGQYIIAENIYVEPDDEPVSIEDRLSQLEEENAIFNDLLLGLLGGELTEEE